MQYLILLIIHDEKLSLFHVLTFIPKETFEVTYQLLQVFIVFTCKIHQKTFAVVKKSAKNMKIFTTNDKRYTVYQYFLKPYTRVGFAVRNIAIY